MSDLISRKAAIEAFCCAGSVFVYGRDVCKAIVSRIMQIPSAQPERWIPCSERLPKKADGKYWICTDTKYQCQCRWTDNVYGLGSSGEWSWNIFDIPQYSHVVAWMPLPDPWIGEDDDRA